jgi:hypothetical protein
MIRLKREDVPVPRIFSSDEMKEERARIAAFFSRPLEARAQSSMPVNRALLSECVWPAFELSKHKCAYCETPVSAASPQQTDSFRPADGALGLEGKASPDHYWWLAYEWGNIIPACVNCNRLKGRRFPVRGVRAQPGTTGALLRKEEPLLLDPFDDQPEQHVVFTEDGLVVSRTEQGRVTIEVLGLNREQLVTARHAALEGMRSELAALGITKASRQRTRLTASDLSFSAIRRQFFSEIIEELQGRRPARKDSSRIQPDGPPNREERDSHFSRFVDEQLRQESYSITSDEQATDYFIKTRFIERIEIQNFRAIAKLTLQFGSSQSEGDSSPYVDQVSGAPWLMLLGENATGKSSVLQAVALCLLGNDWRRQARLDARRFLLRGAESGSVRVFLTGIRQPIHLSFSGRSAEFDSTPGEPKVLLLGYGSTRLLPRGTASDESQRRFAQTDNLFDPFVALGNAGAWLNSLSGPVFDGVARALKRLLQLDEDDRLVRRGTHVMLHVRGGTNTLDELSDGYQSVLALTCDIMRVMLSRWESMETAEGIVILDEIGSHLHPRWRMQVVESMRRTFPRVQFLVSTHDPLCLRGLKDGEVAIMRRDKDNEVIALTEGLPPIRGMRVDQLLTSEFFGLSSTIDPELEQQFHQYYQLLALPTLRPDQVDEVKRLRGQLDRHRVMGSNRRERMMLEVIDGFLSREAAISTSELRMRLSEEVKKEARAIWEGVGPSTPGEGGVA